MNTRFLLAICAVVALSSCSTSYKAQTPDDVYYSPAKPQAEYVKTQTTKEQPSYRYDDRYYDDYYSAEDRYLRWKVRNPQRWSTFDDYSYDMYPNCTSSYAPWRNYWGSYYAWNSYYNPYCHRVIVANPKTNATVYNRVRTYTPGTYNTSTTYNNRNAGSSTKGRGYTPSGSYNNGNNSGSFNNGNNNSLGNSIKKIFNSSGNSGSDGSSSSGDRPNRTYTPSSSSSSSSSGSSSGGSRVGGSSGGSSGGGGGGGGVSRPSRGG